MGRAALRYLTLIYYDTFARFFAAIEDETLRIDRSADFLHLAAFPSGWLYMKRRRRSVRLLPWIARRPHTAKGSDAAETYRNVALYHTRIAELSAGPTTPHDYAELGRNYIQAVSDVLAAHQPDVVILSGDSRVSSSSIQHVLRDQYPTVRVYFFEQGPDGSTLLDPAGVNANASFRRNLGAVVGEDVARARPPRQPRYRRNPLYRATDYCLIAILRAVKRLPPEWESIRLPRLARHEYESLASGEADRVAGDHELLVALQVPDDANNIHHNPNQIDDLELVTLAKQAIETQQGHWKVRVREHPLYRRRYNPGLYALLAASDNVSLSSASLDADIDRATAVLTINSTTGLDAYMRGKPVVVLGDAYYDHLPGVYKCHHPEELRGALERILLEDKDEDLVHARQKIKLELIRKYFIEGHYLDQELRAPAEIARRIANNPPNEPA